MKFLFYCFCFGTCKRQSRKKAHRKLRSPEARSQLMPDFTAGSSAAKQTHNDSRLTKRTEREFYSHSIVEGRQKESQESFLEKWRSQPDKRKKRIASTLYRQSDARSPHTFRIALLKAKPRARASRKERYKSDN